ncbi:MAG: hypothetical protein Q7J57_05475 [Gemmobacter sp.]|nr:hypothetical protein [Gemmobacter sp.]
MHITLSPVRGDAPLTLTRAGDTLTVNGTAFDFAPLPEGGTLPRTAVPGDWLGSDVTRQGGKLRLAIFLPHGARAPAETLFPEALTDPADGPVPLPPFALED